MVLPPAYGSSNPDLSTSETVLQQSWINGKPIYRKVVSTGTLPITTTKNVAHSISNLETVVDLVGLADNATVQQAISSLGTLQVGDTNVTIITTADQSAYTSSHVVIYYTKTTD